MKISALTIKNYRPLEDITLKFNGNINVIYGINGIGKSSILYALHDFLILLQNIGEKRNKLDFNNPHINLFPLGRLHDSQRRAEIMVEFEGGERAKATYVPKGEDIGEPKSGEIPVPFPDGSQVVVDSPGKEIKFSSLIPNLVNIGIVGIQNPDGTIGFSINQPPRFTYTRGIFNFEEFKRSFEELENLENQRKIKEPVYSHPALKKIRNAIPKITGNLTGLTIDREKPHKPLCSIKNGIYMDIEDQLSSGEASIIALITKVALDENKFGGAFTVIIDEIDSSLHPSWQMKTCKVLKETFPAVQFIQTSHSPFIWAGLERNEIIWLDQVDGQVMQKDVKYAKGGSIEDIIAQYFKEDNYDPDFSRELRVIEEELKSLSEREGEEILNNLKLKYGDIPVISQLRLKNRLFRL